MPNPAGGRYTTAEEKRTILWDDQVGVPGRALDIGYGGGRWSRMLGNEVWTVTCTDVDDDAIRLCSEQAPHAQCVRVSPHDKTLPPANASVYLDLRIELLAAVAAPVHATDRTVRPGAVGSPWRRMFRRR
ncbi:class I SAM-dependent methyltransferase [Saccharopolyspora sp. NPDC050389]|uniref:class I SAM-dependent methyltransferase n=1 Tax=Saccharopolyspora sp. NPDC050389 TaxID=3155516 RepID=UPI00340BE488